MLSDFGLSGAPGAPRPRGRFRIQAQGAGSGSVTNRQPGETEPPSRDDDTPLHALSPAGIGSG